jgi:hypothetical protein
MNILHLSNTPLSNAPANLVSIQKEAGHTATLFLHRKSNINKVYVGGNKWDDFSYENLLEHFLRADVIHFHNYSWDLQIFHVYPPLLKVAKAKPCLIQYHSPRNSVESFEESLADSSLKHAVIAQYHVRQYPECEFIVPNVLPIFEERYCGVAARWEDPFVPTVCYSPSNITLKGWDDKGYLLTHAALRDIERTGRISADIIMNTPYEDCMLKKRWAHIGIDEVATGSYHLSTLEFLSMGCVTFVHMDGLTRQAMERIVGPEGIKELPIVDPGKGQLKAALLDTLAKGKPFLQDLGQKSRQWMERYWSPANHVKRFDDIYRSL